MDNSYYSQGAFPQTSLEQACEVIAGEGGRMLPLPWLPATQRGGTLVGRTAAMLESIAVDVGPRAWRIVPNPRLASRRLRDELDRTLDTIEQAWADANIATGKQLSLPMAGPLTLLSQTELASGHRAITDSGAVRDITQALAEGTSTVVANLHRRFHPETVTLQWDEPILHTLLTAGLSGTTQFDPITPWDVARVISAYNTFSNATINLNVSAANTPWAVLDSIAQDVPAITSVLVDPATLRSAASMDAFARLCESRLRIGLALITPGMRIDAAEEQPAHTTKQVASIFHQLQMANPGIDIIDKDTPNAADFAEAGAQLAYARRVSEMLGDVA